MINPYSLFVVLYSKLYSSNNTLNRFLSPFRFLTRELGHIVILKYFSLFRRKIRDNKTEYNRKVIVSLTSFPARIDKVWLVVRGLYEQSVIPDKIILWLSKEQFSNTPLPQNIIKLQDNIFEIKMVDEDIRSHKKYYYSFLEYPDDFVILIDDDLLYHPKMIKSLLDKSLETENTVICSHGSILSYGDNQNLLPFDKRIHIESECDDQNFFFGSGGGTMFIPSLLYKDCCNKKIFMNLAPKADDIWLNAMVRLARLKTYKVNNGILFPVKIENNQTLCSSNLGESQNDVQIANVKKWYMLNLNIDPFKKREYE